MNGEGHTGQVGRIKIRKLYTSEKTKDADTKMG